MVTIALPLAVWGTIVANPIMNFLYGPEYNNGIIAFPAFDLGCSFDLCKYDLCQGDVGL